MARSFSVLLSPPRTRNRRVQHCIWATRGKRYFPFCHDERFAPRVFAVSTIQLTGTMAVGQANGVHVRCGPRDEYRTAPPKCNRSVRLAFRLGFRAAWCLKHPAMGTPRDP